MGIENTVLFGKYRVLKVIGKGRTGCVFLAVHIGLNEYRAVKRVSRECLDYQQFRREGLILKELRHPGIPIVYDLEEDELYCYLIEEYLEGISLYGLVKDTGHLSEAAVILYGCQICRIVNYLHSAGTFPILHLDLQPKNLLLCHHTDIIRLIDFGHAATVIDANLTRQRYGTPGFAAPEQYTDEALDERTDIYAIGVLLHYMCQGTYPRQEPDIAINYRSCGSRLHSRQLESIVKHCLKKDKNLRYQSVQELLEALLRAGRSSADVFTKDQLSSLTIAFAGSKSGAGTTHLALGLSVYLGHLGIPNIYEEKNQTGMASGLGEYFGVQPDRHGLIRVKQCAIRPWLEPYIHPEEITGKVRIVDYGTDLESLCRQKDCQAVVLASKGMWWETRELKRAATYLKSYMNPIIVLPYSIREHPYHIPEEIKELPCYLVPWFPDPFSVSSRTESFYKALLNEILEGKEVAHGLWSGFLENVRNICRRIGGR